MRNSNTIVNYGPNLPPTGSVPDGSVFYVTQGGEMGFHIHRFVSDINSGVAGEQVGFQWATATAEGVNADMLDGHHATYFEPQSVNLDALSSMSKVGFVIRTGIGTYNNTALLEGNGLTFTSVAGTTSDFNLTISVNEAELAINSIGGTLSVAKGGTNSTTVTAGGVAYGTATAIATTVAGTATSGTGINQNWQVIASGGAGAPVWVNATSLNVAHATVAASATRAIDSDSADAVTWAHVTSKPTTVAGFGITDTLTTTQINTADYLNFSPFAGTLKDNKVPVYADFPFSEGKWNTPSYAWVDRESKQVIFYNTTSPVGDDLYYRAYRYSDADSWIYDNLPVSLSFAAVTEKVFFILNMGTNFAVVVLGTRAYPLTNTRIVMVKTNGSSDCNDWVLAYDLTAIYNANTGANFGLVSTASGDRILMTRTASPAGTYKIVLNVYDETLTLQRSIDLYDSLTMADLTDHTAAGRVSNYAHNSITLTNYSGHGQTYGFTWNPFNETFHQHFNSYFTYKTAGGSNVGLGIGVSISFTIPRTWLENGTGTPVNNIPVKTGTYRYNMLADSTWGTLDGGMSSLFTSGAAGSLITDEYSGDMWMTYKGSFQSVYAASNIYRYKANSGHIYQTIDASAAFFGQYTPTGTVNIPDGSPWSKSLYSYYGHVIGNNILMYVASVRYGTVGVQTTFSTTEFSSVQAGMTNDTLKLNSPGAIISPGSIAGTTWPAVVNSNIKPGNMGTVMVGGSPIYYFSNGGSLVYTITASGSTRSFTSTGVTMPIVPAAIDALTGVVDQDTIGWNGDTVSPIWWAVVRDSTGMAYMAKNVAGAWSIVSTNMFQPPIDAGKADRADTTNSIIFPSYSGHPLITENGRFLFNFVVNRTGGTAFYWGCFDINTNIATYGDISRFQSLGAGPGKYGAISGYPGATFGYSSTFGYYHFQSTPVYDAAYFCSSRDVRGVAADITEDEWFNHTATRSEIWITTESATGLVAYLSAFPIFLGGYFSTMATQSVTLLPSTDNYIYATRNAADRNLIDVTVSTLQLPSSFSRVLLAKVSTDATRIVGQVNYNIAPHDAVEDLENVVVTNKVANDVLTWNGTSWVNAPAVSIPPASSITTRELGINDLDNLCYNGKGTSLDGWYTGVANGVQLHTADTYSSIRSYTNTCLAFATRDSYFGPDFDVTPLEQYRCSFYAVARNEATLTDVASSYSFSVGMFFTDVNGGNFTWVAGATMPAGHVGGYNGIGTFVVPMGARRARIWVQLDGPIGTLYTTPNQVMYATNIQVRHFPVESSIPPGTITWNASQTAPSGWLVCNGDSLIRTSYPALFAAIGTTYGSTSSGTFNLPDLRGEFIRGADLGRGVDSFRTIGSWQADLFKSHSHSITGARTFPISINDISGTVLPPNRGDFGSAATAATDTTGGGETRPRNVALLPVIKY